MRQSITKDVLKKYEKDFSSDRANLVAQNAATKSGVAAASANYLAERVDQYEFSISLEQTGITNQKQSGRCWMFAGLNFLRYFMVKKFNLVDFELSQNYTLFYDKLEKANWYLENILDTFDEEVHSRVLDYLVRDPLGDGGQWDMLAALIKKYGLVPKSAMPETFNSSSTHMMTKYMTTKLREDAAILRKAHKDGAKKEELYAMKEDMLEEMYRILCIALGNPPKTFTFEYRDKKKKFFRDENITPKEFYDKYIGVNLDDYISVINAPTEDKPFHRSYTVQYLGNVKEAGGVRYLNLPMKEFKALAIKQLKDKTPVWFGSDVGQFSNREGLMDRDAIGAEDLFDVKFGMTKAERLDYGDSLMTHAMVIQGVNLDEKGKPNRWRVENSWGKESGKDGYYVMSDDWFNEFTYQLVINKKHLTKEQLAQYESDPIVLKPWDPMGSLAK